MKKSFYSQFFILSILVAFVCSFNLYAQTFSDDMEAYATENWLACQNPTDWTTWDSIPCDPVQDAFISDVYAISGANSCVIVADNDLVKPLGNKTTGKWYLKWNYYIPSGKTGYFNTLTHWPYATAEWGMECYFNAGGAGLLSIGTNITFTWVEDQWNVVMVVVDLDTGIAEFWHGPSWAIQVATWDWTRGGTYPNELGANDFFGADVTDEMYFDDYYYSNVDPNIPLPTNDVGMQSIDLATQIPPGIVTPMATVKNYGSSTQTFNVTMTITGGYSSTKSVTSLASGTTQPVTFDNWTGTVGGYSVEVCTQLAGDLNPPNNCLTQSLYVWDGSGAYSIGGLLPNDSTYLGSGVGLNGFVYSIGGNTRSGSSDECYKYEVATDTWSAIAPLPVGKVVLATATDGSFVYAIGGSSAAGGEYTDTVYQYDIGLDAWTQVASLPVALAWCKAVGYNGTHIYLAGGHDGTNYRSTVLVYDVGADTWSNASPMPVATFGGAFSVVGNQLVYAGGASTAGITNAVHVGTITAPTTISWVTAENTYPGVENQTYSESGGDLLETMIPTKIEVGKGLQESSYPPGAMYRFDGARWGSDGMIVAGGSPTSAWSPADPNPCYVYYPATDTWVAQPNVPIPVLGSSLGSVHVGNVWSLVLASGLDAAGPTDITQIFTYTLQTFGFSVSVVDGWNMVSAPGLHPTNQSVATWWSHLTGQVFKFANGYVGVPTVVPGEGYWMKNSVAETYNYPAIDIVTHIPIPAAAGWNMIGGYENNPQTVQLTTNPAGLIVGQVFGYSGGYVPATHLVAGYGYWIKLSGAGDIIIPPQPLAKGSTEVVEYFKDDWGKITITDNAGRSYTLYAVNGKVDLDNYELPPMPPEGMFDIRFGSNRIAEDINSSIQSIEMSGIEHPVRVRVENMSITLQDESGNNINAQLKPGEEITINNSSINKLLIISGEISVPIEYALEQNYPNPFNPSTMIKFSVPEATNVTLTIYNTLGQRVTELVNTKLEAGR